MPYKISLVADGDDVWGRHRLEHVTLQPAAFDYATGGYLIQGISGTTESTGNVGITKVGYVIPIGGQGGVIPVWNPTTSKLQMFVNGAANQPITLGPISAGASTTIGVASNVITVTQPNTLVAGQFVYFQSTGAGAAIAGTILQVASATPAQWTANYPTPNITAATADITITYQLVEVNPGNLVSGGTAATITNSLATTSLLTMTCANSFVPGQFVICQGLTNGANANGVIVQVATASATQFTANWTGSSFSSAADAGTATPLITGGNAPVVSGASVNITNSVATASSAGTAGVVTLSAVNNLAAGNIVVVQGLTNGSAVNGDVGVVLATGLTNALFKFNHKTAAITTGADAGTAALLVTGQPASSSSGGLVEASAGTDFSAYTFNLLAVGY